MLIIAEAANRDPRNNDSEFTLEDEVHLVAVAFPGVTLSDDYFAVRELFDILLLDDSFLKIAHPQVKVVG